MRCGILLFLFLFLVKMPNAALAFEPPKNTCLKTLLNRLYESDAYEPDACGLNIWEFIREARSNKIDLKEANVLFFYTPRKDFFKPLQARAGQVKWSFHVVLEYRGEVFDYDFTDRPNILRTDRYLAEMFGARSSFLSLFWNSASQINVKVIPAAEYLRDYWKLGNKAKYMNSDTDQRYPPQSLGRFLRKLR